jgi:hypothetical protein
MTQVERDDRVLPATRIVSVAIVPFLVVAFVVLYLFPGDTDRLFAWTITPTLTAMVLGAVYLGGAYFFVRAARSTQWHAIKAGFLPVTTFATLMGIATVIHWDKFNHHQLAFWLWAGLYFTTPFLVFGVWLSNRRTESPPTAGDRMVPQPIAMVVGLLGVLACATTVFVFLDPTKAITWWPWLLTPLTARVMAAILALGAAAIGALGEGRWSSMRIMIQVEAVMLGLIAVAVLRAHDQLAGSRPLTWAFGVGFAGVLVGSTWLYRRMSVSPGTDGGALYDGPLKTRHTAPLQEGDRSGPDS